MELIDADLQLIWPPDKNSDAARGERHDDGAMPVPRALCEGLVEFARTRGAKDPDDLVFRYRDGRSISARRYDTIKRRCADLKVVGERDRFGSHDLRSTGAARIEALGGDGRGHVLKQRYLRHAADSHTARYGRAELKELARAVARWTGHPHPLAE